MSQLDIGGSGVMGYIKIPKIDVFLPIYHGTEENVLQTSIGHLEESSLPVGGESAHSMLSGHRGLPSARLFTDLDKLGEGDTFTMTILNETLTYEVDHIWIVEPSDLSHLTIEDGKDYCTLITCTPYGINTHRLLVRAHRIENVNGNAMVIAKAVLVMSMSLVLPLTSIPVSAAESTQVPDPNRTGSISITFTYYDETAKATKPVTGGNSVGLYKVADVADDNTFKFLTD